MKDYRFTGVITSSGKLSINSREELDHFCKMHPGTSYVCNLQVFEPTASAAIKGYYFNKIVYDFQQAFKQSGERLNLKEVEERLREMSPVMQIESFEAGTYKHELKNVEDCTNAELSEFIEHLKQIAAEDFSFYIQDPHEIGQVQKLR